jgi:hypothetical protein
MAIAGGPIWRLTPESARWTELALDRAMKELEMLLAKGRCVQYRCTTRRDSAFEVYPDVVSL